jgi:hypothetical protein
MDVPDFRNSSHPLFMEIQKLVMMVRHLRDDKRKIGHLLPEVLSVSALLRMAEEVDPYDKELHESVAKVEAVLSALVCQNDVKKSENLPLSNNQLESRKALRAALEDVR